MAENYGVGTYVRSNISQIEHRPPLNVRLYMQKIEKMYPIIIPGNRDLRNFPICCIFGGELLPGMNSEAVVSKELYIKLAELACQMSSFNKASLPNGIFEDLDNESCYDFIYVLMENIISGRIEGTFELFEKAIKLFVAIGYNGFFNSEKEKRNWLREMNCRTMIENANRSRPCDMFSLEEVRRKLRCFVETLLVKALNLNRFPERDILRLASFSPEICRKLISKVKVRSSVEYLFQIASSWCANDDNVRSIERVKTLATILLDYFYSSEQILAQIPSGMEIKVMDSYFVEQKHYQTKGKETPRGNEIMFDYFDSEGHYYPDYLYFEKIFKVAKEDLTALNCEDYFCVEFSVNITETFFQEYGPLLPFDPDFVKRINERYWGIIIPTCVKEFPEAIRLYVFLGILSYYGKKMEQKHKKTQP